MPDRFKQGKVLLDDGDWIMYLSVYISSLIIFTFLWKYLGPFFMAINLRQYKMRNT